jgi:hypothetical protein
VREADVRNAGIVASLLVFALSACAPRPDPRVSAAESFRDTAFALIAKDDAETKKLNSLHLGMTDEEVIAAAGAPTSRESRDTASGASREIWVYNGELKELGKLTFEDRKLVQILTE